MRPGVHGISFFPLLLMDFSHAGAGGAGLAGFGPGGHPTEVSGATGATGFGVRFGTFLVAKTGCHVYQPFSWEWFLPPIKMVNWRIGLLLFYPD
jgi:hypothetical protein